MGNRSRVEGLSSYLHGEKTRLALENMPDLGAMALFVFHFIPRRCEKNEVQSTLNYWYSLLCNYIELPEWYMVKTSFWRQEG